MQEHLCRACLCVGWNQGGQLPGLLHIDLYCYLTTIIESLRRGKKTLSGDLRPLRKHAVVLCYNIGQSQ